MCYWLTYSHFGIRLNLKIAVEGLSTKEAHMFVIVSEFTITGGASDIEIFWVATANPKKVWFSFGRVVASGTYKIEFYAVNLGSAINLKFSIWEDTPPLTATSIKLNDDLVSITDLQAYETSSFTLVAGKGCHGCIVISDDTTGGAGKILPIYLIKQ